MRVRVKICGLTTHAAVRAAVDAGADAVGFVFADSPREVPAELAAELARELPAGVARVAVFRHPSPRRVENVLQRFRPDLVQTDAEDLPGLRIPDGVGVLPVFRDVPGTAEAVANYRAAAGTRPRILFESSRSGSGTRVDWDRAAVLARETRVVLAGGLDPDNAGAAIGRVRPYAVDVSSGVESAAGVKDADRIRAFVRAVRTATAGRVPLRGEPA